MRDRRQKGTSDTFGLGFDLERRLLPRLLSDAVDEAGDHKRQASMMANVNRYCASATANDPRGGTNRKSNAATHRIDVSTAGPRE